MKENKLIRALASLSKKEIRDFGTFLHSPYFNNSESNLQLYDYLKGFYPSFASPLLSKKDIFSAVYPDTNYNDKKLRDRFTHLLRQFKVFIAVDRYNTSNFDFKRNLIFALNNKGLDSMLQEEYKEAEKFLETVKFKDEHYYLSRYLLEVSKRELDEPKLAASDRDTLYSKVKIEIDDAIYFFLIVMLKEYSLVTNTERHVKIDHKFKFFEQIINYLSQEEENYKDIVMINVFYNFFQIYKIERDYSLIAFTKDLLIDNKDKLPDRIFKMLFIEIYNHCKRRQSCGEKEFGKISFDLINEMLAMDVFLRDDGTMSDHTYINLAASGLREQDLAWTENFIDQYKNKVVSDNRENAYNYNYAVLYYMKGYGQDKFAKENAYKIAFDFLSKVKSDNFYYMTRIKNHSLKIFYELNFLEQASYVIDSYFHYLTRNPKIPERLAERYHNFISYLRRLIKLKEKPDDYALQKLKSDLHSNVNTEYRGWLIERINEIY